MYLPSDSIILNYVTSVFKIIPITANYNIWFIVEYIYLPNLRLEQNTIVHRRIVMCVAKVKHWAIRLACAMQVPTYVREKWCVRMRSHKRFSIGKKKEEMIFDSTETQEPIWHVMGRQYFSTRKVEPQRTTNSCLAIARSSLVDSTST